ncbi:hypothetical protein F4782DRAFT_524420 [Xylaria castorea]|nr:hypothetical protein F4782DRAFT_524420 [Xylaria castorea]
MKNTRYNDLPAPAVPGCGHAVNTSGSVRYCKRFSYEGWCDYGSAEDYAQLNGADTCTSMAGRRSTPSTSTRTVAALCPRLLQIANARITIRR